FVLSRRSDDRLRTGKERRHYHLVAEYEVVDDRMVAVELPTPRFCCRRRAHDSDVILPLAVFVEIVVGQLGQRVVEAHDVARLLQSFRAQAGAQQAERLFALRVGHLQKTDTLPGVKALVHPLAPLVVVDWKHRLVALGLGEARQKCLSRAPHGLGRYTRRMDAEKPGLDLTVSGDALERLCKARRLGLDR